MSVAIVTDSTCDIAPQELQYLGVSSLSTEVMLGGETYIDWKDIDSRRIFQAIKAGQHATTQPPSAEQFRQVYLSLLSQGQQIVSVHVSRQLSATLSNAAKAVADLGAQRRIHLVDSSQASVALAEQVLCAAALAREGYTPAEIVATLRQVRLHMQAEFCVESLEHLRRMGRLSAAGALLSNLLGQRLVLGFKDGNIVTLRKVRSEQAVEDLIAKLEARYAGAPIAITAVSAAASRLAELKAALQHSNLNIQRGRLQCFGAVNGANLGPGSFGFLAVPMSTLLLPRSALRSAPQLLGR